MVIALATKPGINGANTLSIPTEWDATWFRKFIANSLKGADVRNAVGSGGISVTGNIASPYATIGFAAPVTIPGPVTINGAAGSPALTVNANAASGSIGISSTVRSSYSDLNGHFDIASSNGDYPRAGYNIASTGTTGVYHYAVSDFASVIAYTAGTFNFQVAPSGTAGNPITFSSTLSIANNGAVTIASPSTAVTALTVNGQGAATFVAALVAGSANMSNALLYLSGGASSAGVETIRADHCATTGTGTATFTATNKPTATAGGPVTWLPINIDGTRRYIPVWA